MANQVGSQLAVVQVPHLDEFIPTARDDDRVRRCRGESNARNPLRVAFVFLNRVFALAQSVPQFNRLISGAGDDLSVVHGERDGQDVFAVTDKSSRGCARVQVPQSQGTVPGTGQGELPVRGDDDVLDKVRVTVQASSRVAVVAFFSGQRPQDDGFISGRGQENVRVIKGSGDGSHPAFVSVFFYVVCWLLLRRRECQSHAFYSYI